MGACDHAFEDPVLAIVRVEGSINGELRCDIPCGFGVLEGQYEFTVKAPGYLDHRVTTMASYRRFEGGCPSRNSGSTEITLSLVPAAS